MKPKEQIIEAARELVDEGKISLPKLRVAWSELKEAEAFIELKLEELEKVLRAQGLDV